MLLAVAMTAGAVAVGGDGQDAARALPGVSRAVNADVLVRGTWIRRSGRCRNTCAGSHGTPGPGPPSGSRRSSGRGPTGTLPLRPGRTRPRPVLALRPGNDQALAGQAALAAARHHFAAALDHADRALERNPYSERALCSRIDALVELGRYAEAAEAATLADRRRPGVPVFTRYAYVHELRGDVRTARRVLHQALASAVARPTWRTWRPRSATSNAAGAVTAPPCATTPARSPRTTPTSPPWRAGPAPRRRTATARARS
ncbi:type IV pilus biogenesis/stability protein PilW [Streptomyces thermocarboxydus]